MDFLNKTQIYNLVILDKSGSMESIRTEAINGYNETLASIKATQEEFSETQDHFISLAAFCNHGIDMIHNMTPINEAEKLTREKYSPCCLTPLFDAIGTTVKLLQKKTAKKRVGLSHSLELEKMSSKLPAPSLSTTQCYGRTHQKALKRCS